MRYQPINYIIFEVDWHTSNNNTFKLNHNPCKFTSSKFNLNLLEISSVFIIRWSSNWALSHSIMILMHHAFVILSTVIADAPPPPFQFTAFQSLLLMHHHLRYRFLLRLSVRVVDCVPCDQQCVLRTFCKAFILAWEFFLWVVLYIAWEWKMWWKI